MSLFVETRMLPQLINDFFDMLNKGMSQQSASSILCLMSVMTQFFEKVPMETLVLGKAIVIRSLHLISFEGDNAVQVHAALGRFLMVR